METLSLVPCRLLESVQADWETFLLLFSIVREELVKVVV